MFPTLLNWALKNRCFWTMMLEKTLESPLDCKEIQPVHLKGNQSWICTGRTDAEAETSILWPPDVMNWLIGKDPNAGKDWRQEEKATAENEMVGWHLCHDVHDFEQDPGLGDEQGPWCAAVHGVKKSQTTQWLNWTQHGMAHSFIELDKAVVHVISLTSFLWHWFSFCPPSDT